MKNLNKKGFTLLETMVVIGIFMIIMAFGLLATQDSFKGTIFRSERVTILSVLERARSRSMNNYMNTFHGACFENANPSKPRYVNFSGTYSPSNPNNEYLDASPAVSIISTPDIFSCANGGIIFSQLSGKTSNVNIAYSEDGRTSTISTNLHGRIDW